jgi:hypothetical protein
MPAPDVLDVASKPGGRSAEAPERLVVAWQHPIKRHIEPVGFLSFDGRIYEFTYIRNAEDLEDFPGLLGFADIRLAYRSEELFPLFAQRAMDPRRPDYERYVERLGLQGEQPGPWEQIARSQGRRHGDTLQLFPEPSIIGDELTCLFLVHGVRWVADVPRILDGHEIRVTTEQVDTALAGLRRGAPLGIAREPGNEFNPLSLMVMGSPSVPVGWIPDLLVADMQRLLERSEVFVTAEQVNGPDAPLHMRLLARLRAVPADGFQFFTDERWESLASSANQ